MASEVIRPNRISPDEIIKDIYNYVLTKQDDAKWTDFSNNSTGQIMSELLGGVGSFVSFHFISYKVDQFLFTCRDIKYARACAEILGYSAFRGLNTRIAVTFTANIPYAIHKFDVIGAYNYLDLVALEDAVFLQGDTVTITCAIGNLLTEDKVVTTNEANRFVFFDDLVSEDFQIELNGNAVPMGTRYKELLENKFVCITNANGAVSVTYLNNSGDFTESIGVGNNSISTYRYTLQNLPQPGTVKIYLKNNTTITATDEPQDQNVGIFANEYISGLVNYTSGALEITFTSVPPYGSDILVDYTMTDAPVTYTVGDTLTLKYISYNPVEFQRVEIDTFYGAYVDSEIVDTFIPEETLEQIKINAPLSHETQILIRGRKDYMYIFKQLDPRIVDTNYIDESPAIVVLSYIRYDEKLFTEAEKEAIIAELGKEAGRAMGIPNPKIEDPIKVSRKIAISLTLVRNGDPSTVYQDCDEICASYSKKLGATLNMEDLEEDFENLDYVKIARISLFFNPWQSETAYNIGDLVNPLEYNGYYYECVKAGTSAILPPTFPETDNETWNDNTVIWQTHIHNDEPLTHAWNEYFNLEYYLYPLNR